MLGKSSASPMRNGPQNLFAFKGILRLGGSIPPSPYPDHLANTEKLKLRVGLDTVYY